MSTTTVAPATPAALPDSEIVDRVIGGERALFEILMRRHNQRIYRVVRAVLKDEHEVEDAMQQAYINAFVHLDQFERRSQFATWLTRIALNESFVRLRRRQASIERVGKTVPSQQPDPERQAYAAELTRALQWALDALPEIYRSVFILRDVEGLSTSETAAGLGLGEEVVKTRLHRARAMLRRAVAERIGGCARAAFQFQVPRCDRIVAAVLTRIECLADAAAR